MLIDIGYNTIFRVERIGKLIIVNNKVINSLLNVMSNSDNNIVTGTLTHILF